MHQRAFAWLFAAALIVPMHVAAETRAPLPPRRSTVPPAPTTSATTPTVSPAAPTTPPAIDNEDRNPLAEMTGTRLEKRAKLRACATEWDAMKNARTDEGRTWRDFSVGCLLKGQQDTAKSDHPPG